MSGIQNGAIQKKYHSQDVKQPDSALIRLNGNSYSDFMNDTENDLIVMYINGETSYSDVLEMISNEMKNVSGIRFGIIDVVLNSAPVRLPKIPVAPQIRVYPKANRTAEMPFPQAFTRDNLLTFINRTTSVGMPLDLQGAIDTTGFKNDVGRFVTEMGIYPDADREKIAAYFKQMWLDLGIEFGVHVRQNEEL